MLHNKVLAMFQGLKQWIEEQLDKYSFQKANGDEKDSDDVLVISETEIQPLTDFQRFLFMSLTIFIFVIAFFGNILVLYVNFSRSVKFNLNKKSRDSMNLGVFIFRKQRFFFRVCLISLAISDLVYAIVTTWIYISLLRCSASALWVRDLIIFAK